MPSWFLKLFFAFFLGLFRHQHVGLDEGAGLADRPKRRPEMDSNGELSL
jgi:hypothetical protein